MERRPSLLLRYGSLFLFALFMLACQQQPRPTDAGTPLDLSELLLDKDLQSLGRNIFFDSNLSTPPGQACAACHSPEVGWTGPDEELNKRGSVYTGGGAHPVRKPQAECVRLCNPHAGHFMPCAKGKKSFLSAEISGTAGQQAGSSVTLRQIRRRGRSSIRWSRTTPVRKLSWTRSVPQHMRRNSNRTAKRIWDIDDVCTSDPEFAYGIVAIAIAAFEHSPMVNQFSSKYDLYLKEKAALTAEEKRGLDLFEGKARCADCHTSRPGPNGEPPLFTDFTYDNLGFPKTRTTPGTRCPRN